MLPNSLGLNQNDSPFFSQASQHRIGSCFIFFATKRHIPEYAFKFHLRSLAKRQTYVKQPFFHKLLFRSWLVLL